VVLAAAASAKNHGAFIVSTKHNLDRRQIPHESGAEQVFIDSGAIAEQVKEKFSEGFDKVLELIGTVTLKDSLRCAKQGGIVCMTGIVGNKWSFDYFSPMEAIPTAVSLTNLRRRVRRFHEDAARGTGAPDRCRHAAHPDRQNFPSQRECGNASLDGRGQSRRQDHGAYLAFRGAASIPPFG
jgi:NADPH:quinone reductase-like Zn-dependent oxidoreductase